MSSILPHLRLRAGGYTDPNEGACVMNVAHMAMGARRLIEGRWSGVDITDLPECTHPAIARAAQHAWDLLPGENTPEHLRFLAAFLPRLMRAKRTNNVRVNVRIALAAARAVEHLGPPETKACNDELEAWLRGESSIEQVMEARKKARAADAAAHAADAAHAAAAHAADAATDADAHATDAATDADAHAADAATDAAAHAADAATDADAARDLLDHLLTTHEKACADEGELAFDPEPWEDDAIAFVDQLMNEIANTLGDTAVTA